jgi:hypothetical protein
MIVAKAVAVLPTSTERLDGNTAAGSGPVLAGVVIRPTLAPPTNHSAPSGPAVIPSGLIKAVGSEYSVIVPEVVIRSILFPLPSTNHKAPSGPAVILAGELDVVGMPNSVTAPDVVIHPTLLALSSVNHNAPSAPTAM